MTPNKPDWPFVICDKCGEKIMMKKDPSTKTGWSPRNADKPEKYHQCAARVRQSVNATHKIVKKAVDPVDNPFNKERKKEDDFPDGEPVHEPVKGIDFAVKKTTINDSLRELIAHHKKIINILEGMK